MLKDLVAQFCVIYGCATAPVITDATVVKNATVVTKKAGKPLKACVAKLKYFKKTKHVSLIMAQAEQESICNPWAKSKYASGVMQFTPSTGRWASRSICKSLGTFKPHNTRWSILCGIKYMDWLRARSPYKSKFLLNYEVALMRYNGGGHVLKELRRSKSNDLKKARKHCRRARWACKENYEYAPRIFKKRPKYARYDR